ncbi:DNA-3-methyladenine glycosylase [Cellulomonas fimi]|uniref:Putative 3-methyladenine DNA glycosylase n=1 Tax=Cellulomonas fimi TaxID=1708 RepID=A0A7Y0LZ11_CELFI|nr:DNA-3-methyladenine glycosylase [Cellulomonas fimi]NMR20559.1 DNA-3-methyladenine glycosylase [Cellulomonas fimi]
MTEPAPRSPERTAPPPREWYGRDALSVARDLLGAYLTTDDDEGRVTLRLTEVEAYQGARDPASHAYRGRTARNAAMFAEAGHLYVYRHLGLHHCVNVVCGPTGEAAAVLLRAGEIVAGAELARERRTRSGVAADDVQLARGPARLAVALGLDLRRYGADVTRAGGAVVVHRGPDPAPPAVGTGPRVGVSGPGADAELFPWRLWLPGEPTVSAYRPGYRRRPAGSRTART